MFGAPPAHPSGSEDDVWAIAGRPTHTQGGAHAYVHPGIVRGGKARACSSSGVRSSKWGQAPPSGTPLCPGCSGRLRRIPPGLKPTSGRSREDGLTHRAEPMLTSTRGSFEGGRRGHALPPACVTLTLEQARDDRASSPGGEVGGWPKALTRRGVVDCWRTSAGGW